MNLITLETNLNNLFQPQQFHDFCPNGLIVDASGDKTCKVKKVVTGVSLRKELIEEAIQRGADVIFVHHPNGFWNSDKNKRIDNSQFGNYARMLVRNGISLFGYHLPLDAHETYGNNATVYKLLGLDVMPERFMHDNIGYGGEGIISSGLLYKTFPQGFQSFNFDDGMACKAGKKYKVVVCTGSATSEFDEIVARGYNMLVTGEVRESIPILAKEYGIAVIAAGHHRSEVFGVRNMATYISNNMGVEAEFVDIDNPV